MTFQDQKPRGRHPVTYNGQTKPVSTWAAELGVNASTLSSRILRYGLDRAMTAPKPIPRGRHSPKLIQHDEPHFEMIGAQLGMTRQRTHQVFLIATEKLSILGRLVELLGKERGLAECERIRAEGIRRWRSLLANWEQALRKTGRAA